MCKEENQLNKTKFTKDADRCHLGKLMNFFDWYVLDIARSPNRHFIQKPAGVYVVWQINRHARMQDEAYILKKKREAEREREKRQTMKTINMVAQNVANGTWSSHV